MANIFGTEEFIIEAKNKTLVENTSVKIGRLFNVKIGFDIVSKDDGQPKQWLVVTGRKVSRQNAKEYILALCSPEQTSIVPCSSHLDDVALENIERLTKAHLERTSGAGAGRVQVKGTQLACTLAISQLELEAEHPGLQEMGIRERESAGGSNSSSRWPQQRQNQNPSPTEVTDRVQGLAMDTATDSVTDDQLFSSAVLSMTKSPQTSALPKPIPRKRTTKTAEVPSTVETSSSPTPHTSAFTSPKERSISGKRVHSPGAVVKDGVKPVVDDKSVAEDGVAKPGSEIGSDVDAEAQKAEMVSLGLGIGFSKEDVQEASMFFDFTAHAVTPDVFLATLNQVRARQKPTEMSSHSPRSPSKAMNSDSHSKLFSLPSGTIQSTSDTDIQKSTVNQHETRKTEHRFESVGSTSVAKTHLLPFSSKSPSHATSPDKRAAEQREDRQPRVICVEDELNDSVVCLGQAMDLDQSVVLMDAFPSPTNALSSSPKPVLKPDDRKMASHVSGSTSSQRSSPKPVLKPDDWKMASHLPGPTNSQHNSRESTPEHGDWKMASHLPGPTNSQRSSREPTPETSCWNTASKKRKELSSDEEETLVLKPFHSTQPDNQRAESWSRDIAQPSHQPHQEPSVSSSQKETADSHLRYIVIDGSNVAMSHGNDQIFSCKGIRLCVDHFLKRGHRVKAFVPRTKTYKNQNVPIRDQHILDEMKEQGVLGFTPARKLANKHIVSHDDYFILDLAKLEDAVVVSNDNFREFVSEYHDVIANRVLSYVFSDDHFMLPKDPLGRYGPTLDDFLQKNPTPSTSQSGSSRPGVSTGFVHPHPRPGKTGRGGKNSALVRPLVRLQTSPPRPAHVTKDLEQTLQSVFPKQEAKIREVLENHPSETDLTKLSNYCISALDM